MQTGEVAKLFGVGNATVINWVERGVLPCLKLEINGRSFLRFDPEELKSWVSQKGSGSLAPVLNALKKAAATENNWNDIKMETL